VYRAWVGLNPSLSQLGEVNFHLMQMFELGFETLRRHGVLSECEFYVDIDHADFSNYLYLDTALRSANQHFMPQGTMYLGSRHGKRRVTVYDKAKQLAEVKDIMLSSDRLRIEGKVSGGAYAFKDLTSVRNPFETLHVLEKDALEGIATSAMVAFKQHLSWGMSAQMAYQCLSKGQKAALAEVLCEARPSWWQPGEAWGMVLSNLGWINVLSHAGMTGEYLPMGEAAYQQCTL
jgi:hypothetical protein